MSSNSTSNSSKNSKKKPLTSSKTPDNRTLKTEYSRQRIRAFRLSEIRSANQTILPSPCGLTGRGKKSLPLDGGRLGWGATPLVQVQYLPLSAPSGRGLG